MASAFVTNIRSGGKGPEGFVVFVIACTYTGADVQEEIEGQSYDVPVVVATGFDLTDLRTGIAAAVVDQGTVLGLTTATVASFVLAVGVPGVAPSVEALTTAVLTIDDTIHSTYLGGQIFDATNATPNAKTFDMANDSGTVRMLVEATAPGTTIPSTSAGMSIFGATSNTETGIITNSLLRLVIGAAGDFDFKGNAITGIAATSEIGWSTRASMLSPSDGVLTLYNNAQTDFTALHFGGDTSSFPALAHSGAGLVALLADHSADANFRCFMLQLQGNSSAAPALARSGTTLVARLADDSADTAFRCAAFTATTGTFSGLATFNLGATVASGQTLTLTGATVTGLTAASVGAGTYPAGAHVFAGAVSGITTLVIGGAFTGATTGAFSGNVTVLSVTVGASKVVGARRTGWTDQTAVAARTDLGTSPTAANIAKAFRALYDDLKSHGLIGN